MPTPMPAALLKLRGVPNVWRLCIGDYAGQIDLLRQHCPFDLEAVLIAPRTTPESHFLALEAVQRFAAPCHNEWFRASSSTAYAIFQSILPGDFDETCPSSPAGSNLFHADPGQAPSEGEDTVMAESLPPAADTTVVARGEDVATSDVPPQLWEYVEPCSTRDATKALDIRAALVAKLGKPRATELLSYTRATVAKDAQGRNNRVLRANGTLLKLRA